MAFTKEPLGDPPWFVTARVSRRVYKPKKGGRLTGPPSMRRDARLELSGRVAKACGVEPGATFAVSVPKPGFVLLQRVPDRDKLREEWGRRGRKPG